MASWNRVSVWMAGAAVSLAAQSTLAASVVFNFDALADAEVVTAQFPGLTFTNARALTAGVSLNAAQFPPRSGANVVFDNGGPMVIDFGVGLASVGGYFSYAHTVTLVAFDSGHNVLGSVTSAFGSNLADSGDVGSSPNELLSFAVNGGNPLIASVTITGDAGGGSFTLDDLTVDTGGIAVPEPASLLLTGGALAGLVIGRRRRGAVAI